MLRRIFVPKRDYIIGDLRKLRNEELHNFYSFLDIVRYIKSRKIRKTGHIVCMGE
jgi:hypothetical protein